MKNIYKNKNGFTLVELLAVIVILGLLLVLAIPSVLDTVQKSRKETFGEYVQKLITTTQEESLRLIAADQSKLEQECFAYNIEKDLGLSETGEFHGWIVYDTTDEKIYLTIYTNDYMLVNYVYSAENRPKDLLKDIKSNTDVYSEDKIEDIKETSGGSPLLVFDTIALDGEEKLSIKCADTYVDEDDIPDDPDEPGLEDNYKIYLLSGREINRKFKKLSNINDTYLSKNTTITSIQLVSAKNKPDTATLISENTKGYRKAYAWLTGTTVNWTYDGYEEGIEDGISIIIPKDMSYMFSNFSNLTTITGLFKFKNNPNGVTDVSYMFFGDTQLKNIDGGNVLNLNFINTSRVKSMIYLFSGCQKLEAVNISSWEGNSVTSMLAMFQDCQSISTLDIRSLKPTTNLTNLTQMFQNCHSLKEIFGLGYFETDGVLSFTSMFENCYSLEIINITGWNYNTDKEMLFLNKIFFHCYALKFIVGDKSVALYIKTDSEHTSNAFDGDTSLFTWKNNITGLGSWFSGYKYYSSVTRETYYGLQFKNVPSFLQGFVDKADVTNMYVPMDKKNGLTERYVITPIAFIREEPSVQRDFAPYMPEIAARGF